MLKSAAVVLLHIKIRQEYCKNVTGVGKIQDVNTTSVKADTTHLTFGSTDIFIVGKKDSLRFQRKQSTKPIWGGGNSGLIPG